MAASVLLDGDHASGTLEVIITDRGRPAHVLLSFGDYQRLTLDQGGFIDSLGLPPGVEDVELEIPSLRDLPRPAHLG